LAQEPAATNKIGATSFCPLNGQRPWLKLAQTGFEPVTLGQKTKTTKENFV